jgi:hypothetical protein
MEDVKFPMDAQVGEPLSSGIEIHWPFRWCFTRFSHPGKFWGKNKQLASSPPSSPVRSSW